MNEYDSARWDSNSGPPIWRRTTTLTSLNESGAQFLSVENRTLRRQLSVGLEADHHSERRHVNLSSLSC